MFTTESRPRGFSLIEFMIYIAVISVAMAVFTRFTIDVSRQAAEAKSKRAVQQNAQVLLTRLTQEIRASQSFTINAPDSITVQNSTGTATISLNGSEVDYNKGSAVALSDNQVNVTQLNFQSLASPAGVTVTLTVASRYPAATGGIYAVTVNFTVVPRQPLYS